MKGTWAFQWSFPVVSLLVLSACVGYFPLERPGYDPAGEVSEDRRAWVWSEGHEVEGTDVDRVTHGAVGLGYVVEYPRDDGTTGYYHTIRYYPDFDLADEPTRLGIDGPGIGYRTLTWVGDRYFLTWQVGEAAIYGQFRYGDSGNALEPDGEPILLSQGSAPRLTPPQSVRVYERGEGFIGETVVQGPQYDVAFSQRSNQIMIVWREALGTGTQIAYRTVDAETGALGVIGYVPQSSPASDSWPQVAAAMFESHYPDFCIAYIREQGTDLRAYVFMPGLIDREGELGLPVQVDPATPDNHRVAVESRGESVLGSGVGWGFFVLFDSPAGIHASFLWVSPGDDDIQPSQPTLVWDGNRGQERRDSQILIDLNEDNAQFALGYYEKETVECFCEDVECRCVDGQLDCDSPPPEWPLAECPCAGIEQDRYVYYGQRLRVDSGSSLMPDREGGSVGPIRRTRIFPPASGIYPAATRTACENAPTHWQSAGRAALTAWDTGLCVIEQHTFEAVVDVERGTRVGRWRPDLLELKARWYPRRAGDAAGR
jgi:hypothetical protein